MFPKAHGCVISTRLAGMPKEAVLDSRPYCGQIQRHLKKILFYLLELFILHLFSHYSEYSPSVLYL